MKPLFTNALLAALLAAPVAMHAQTATLLGSLANFDVLNDTGQDTHGFEIDLQGVSRAQIISAFPATRYGAPPYVPFTGGISVIWASPYDSSNQRFRIF